MPQLGEIEQLLAEGAARAAAQVEGSRRRCRSCCRADGGRARCKRDTYGEARSARKDAKHSKRAFHEWRRRSKELTYQLELLAGYAGGRTSDLHREVEHVTDTQGPAVDLLMLRDLVARTPMGFLRRRSID